MSIVRFFRRLWYRYVYLRSRHWQEFRKIALKRAEWRCEYPGCRAIDHSRPFCGRKEILRFKWLIESLDVHHLSYKNLGHETVADVQVLCRKHHEELERQKRRK